MTALTTRPDPRPVWLRVLVWAGVVIGAVAGTTMVVGGLVRLDDPPSRFVLCFGLLVVVGVVGAGAREVAELRIARRPPVPRLEPLPDGERALLVPRDPSPTRIASRVLLGFALAVGLAATFAAMSRAWVWTSLLVLLTAYLVRVAAPHRDGAMAGGLWFTPTRLVHEHQGIRWEVPWDDVQTATLPQEPLRVSIRADRTPTITRTGPRGRGWGPRRGGRVLVVETAHLPGGSTLAGYLVWKSVTDPASREAFGTPESLPPGRDAV